MKLLSGSAGIVNTGTTLLMITTDAFQKYQKATGATMDEMTGLLTISESQFEKLQSLFFNIGVSWSCCYVCIQAGADVCGRCQAT